MAKKKVVKKKTSKKVKPQKSYLLFTVKSRNDDGSINDLNVEGANISPADTTLMFKVLGDHLRGLLNNEEK